MVTHITSTWLVGLSWLKDLLFLIEIAQLAHEKGYTQWFYTLMEVLKGRVSAEFAKDSDHSDSETHSPNRSSLRVMERGE